MLSVYQFVFVVEWDDDPFVMIPCVEVQNEGVWTEIRFCESELPPSTRHHSCVLTFTIPQDGPVSITDATGDVVDQNAKYREKFVDSDFLNHFLINVK